ncbi:hypothetical protein N7475_007726 [Penicillium sp. IBT 31633x]|nr:hypothetical protein N7475_007726 [Penicillium sp. IBT 31633x]
MFFLTTKQLFHSRFGFFNGTALNPGYSKVFSDHASDISSSTEPSIFESSSKCEDKSIDKLKDKLVSEDKEEQLLLEYYLHKAESLNVS